MIKYDLLYMFRDFRVHWFPVAYCQNVSYRRCRSEADKLLELHHGAVITRIVQHKD